MRIESVLIALLLASCSSSDPKPTPPECEDEDCEPDTDDQDDVANDDEVAERRDASTRDAARDARPADTIDAADDLPPAKNDASVPPSDDPPAPGDNCLAGTSTDYRANGPYGVKMKDIDLGGSLGPYTIFYPDKLEADCKHPVIAWGNGTGVTGPGVYAHFFKHAASWGLITIAAHNSNAQSQPFLASGLDYLLKGMDDELAGKLSERAGTSGHSQGGFAATSAGSHPNVVATVSVQGGGVPPAKVAFVCETGVEDFVRSGCTMSYKSAAGPSFLADHMTADHINTPTTLGATTPAGKEYIRIYTAWFRCFLADDQSACALFEDGDSATVCEGGDWATCSGKNFK
jgi:hypothetical protein